MKKGIAIIMIVWCFFNAEGQTNCYFKADEAKILNNRNLDFFVKKIQSDTFKVSRNKHEIPPYVREQLTCLTKDSLLANPNEEWNSSDAIMQGDIRRQLVFFAQNKGICVIVYRLGGFAVHNHVILMSFFDKRLVDLWSGVKGYEIKNIKDVLKFIQGNENKQMGIDGLFY